MLIMTESALNPHYCPRSVDACPSAPLSFPDQRLRCRARAMHSAVTHAPARHLIVLSLEDVEVEEQKNDFSTDKVRLISKVT